MPADTETAAITDDQTSQIETYLTDIAQGVSRLLPESAQSSWQLILQHPILGALLIAVASYIIAISFRSLLAGLVGRITGLTRPSVDDAVMKDLRKPIFNTIFFLGLSLAIVVANLPLGGVTLIKLFLSFITASWMGAVIKISTLALQALSRENRFHLVDARTVPLLDLTSKLLSIMIGSYVLLIIWGINPVGWLASAGIVGLALGFAAKDTLGNLFSGFFIVADAPYKIGDYINLDSGERGKVCAIGLRSTRLLTRDDVEITIPNGVIANAKIINESGGPLSLRIRIVVGVAYGSDADQVVQLLLKAGTGHSEVCKLPEPRVRLRGFGASSLDFNLMCWITKPEDRGRIAHELHMTIYRLFNEHGVEIPYAKRDLYIKQWPKDNSPK
ncbi:MAG: MscS family membrane protein [Marinobacter maritimus]|jgi:MscS family membrane protein|uniref:mechanosensitive ion channel family protein n=1 Tax=Marinobacter maritimus TaxID=277961 RepID=UPI000BDD0149|nr:mechanosensitive ion channel family protein [Marinobacter maritimus]MBL1270933.1 mechanosensitive ion channel family protein [Oceanospirillales bacterium]